MARDLVQMFVCGDGLVMRSIFPTSDGVYAFGIELNLATPVQLRLRDLLKKVPHTGDPDNDLSVTPETICRHFSLSDWNPDSLSCSVEQLGIVSDLLPVSRRHMPVYFTVGNDVLVGVWEPSHDLVRWLKDLSEEDRSFYKKVFANTKRAVA